MILDYWVKRLLTAKDEDIPAGERLYRTWVNFKELSLTLMVGASTWWWCATRATAWVFAGSPLTNFGPVSLVSDAKDALFKNKWNCKQIYVLGNDRSTLVKIIKFYALQGRFSISIMIRNNIHFHFFYSIGFSGPSKREETRTSFCISHPWTRRFLTHQSRGPTSNPPQKYNTAWSTLMDQSQSSTNFLRRPIIPNERGRDPHGNLFFFSLGDHDIHVTHILKIY